MSVLQSPRALVVTALLGVGLALVVSFAVQRESLPPSPAATDVKGLPGPEGGDRVTATVGVDSDEPGARFALVANDRIGGPDREFVTPFTFEYDGPALNLAVLALEADTRLYLSVNGNPVTLAPTEAEDRITADRPAFLRISPSMIRATAGLSGKALDATLSDAGGPYPGVQFGGGLLCAQPEVWSLALAGDAAQARGRCLEAARIESLVQGKE